MARNIRARALLLTLKVDNTQTMKMLFGEAKVSLPYSVEDEIRLMFKDADY